MNPELIVIVALASASIGLSKGGLGASLAVIVTPLLSLVMTVPQAISTALPLLLIGDLFALWAFRGTWDMRYIRLLLPTSIVGIVVGTLLLAYLPDAALRRIVGVFVLVFIGLRLLDARLRLLDYQPRDWHGMAAGAVAGVASALANVGGPAYTMYMLFQPVTPVVFVGTTTLYFALVNALKVPGLIAAGLFDLHDLLAVVWAVPIIPVGVWLGRWLIRRLDRQRFDQVMLVALGVAAFVLIFVPPR